MLDMSKFWSSLKEATEDLGGTHFTKHEPLCADGMRRWPSWIRSGTVHMAAEDDVELQYVDCYGYCRIRK